MKNNDGKLAGWHEYTCPYCDEHCIIYHQDPSVEPTLAAVCFTRREARQRAKENITRHQVGRPKQSPESPGARAKHPRGWWTK